MGYPIKNIARNGWTRRRIYESVRNPEIALVELTQGQVAWIDRADVEQLAPLAWCAQYHKRGRRWEAKTSITNEAGKPATISMHRFLMGNPTGAFVDHVNHNPLDNRRANQRLATPADNSYNIHTRRTPSTPYKGVRTRTNGYTWIAQIYVKGRNYHLGTFDTAEKAAGAYNRAAQAAFGPYAFSETLDSLSGPSTSPWTIPPYRGPGEGGALPEEQGEGGAPGAYSPSAHCHVMDGYIEVDEPIPDGWGKYPYPPGQAQKE